MKTFLIVACGAVILGCATSTRWPQRHEYERPQMGMPFRIVLYASDKAVADSAAEAAFARVAELNLILSDYDTDSELSRLSQTGGQRRAVPVSLDLWRVLERAQRLAAETSGAFDVTCGPVVSLWRKARREKKLPEATSMEEARQASGYTKLRLNPDARTAELLVSYMRLDLGAIAKGYAIDEALAVLRARGVTRALVSGGGDMAASGAPPGAKGWRVELAPLDATNSPPANSVLLKDRALATSGDLFQHVEIGGRRYSHIVDPRTGIGLTDHSQVVVVARDAMTADSISTAVSVLGPVKGLNLAESKGACARIVRKPGTAIEIHESICFRRYLAQ